MSNSRISPALRQGVAEASQYRCGYCLTSQRIIGSLLEIDHSTPESKGGASEEENLWLACPMCNSYKSDRVGAIDPESQEVVPIFNARQQRWFVSLILAFTVVNATPGRFGYAESLK